jgi:hypothetical protein
VSNDWSLVDAQVGDPNKESIYNDLVEDLIKGIGGPLTVDFTSDNNFTPTYSPPSNHGVMVAYVLNVTSAFGSLTVTRNLVLPLKKKAWVIRNNTTGGQAIQAIGATGTGVVIPNGASLEVVCDGTNFSQLRPGDQVTARKTADQLLIGTAFADVSGTGLPVAANSAYAFGFWIIADADAVTTGIDIAVNGPAAPTSINYEQIYWTSATARTERPASAYDNNTASTGSNGTTRAIFVVRGILVNGANVGTLIARIKREAVGTGPNVRAGSFGRLTKL